MSFDLSSVDTVAACNKGTEIELKHPVTNEPTGVFWGILGRDSDAYREYFRELANARIRKEVMARKRGKDVEVETVEVAEAKAIELLVSCSTGWRSEDKPTLTFKGEELEFTVMNAKTVLEALPWVRRQIEDGIDDLENFMKS